MKITTKFLITTIHNSSTRCKLKLFQTSLTYGIPWTMHLNNDDSDIVTRKDSVLVCIRGHYS